MTYLSMVVSLGLLVPPSSLGFSAFPRTWDTSIPSAAPIDLIMPNLVMGSEPHHWYTPRTEESPFCEQGSYTLQKAFIFPERCVCFKWKLLIRYELP